MDASDMARLALPSMQRGLAERLFQLHEQIKATGSCASLSRIAVALYDDSTGLLKTFLHSSDGASPLDHSVVRLADLPTLRKLAETGEERVLNDLSFPANLGQEQAQKLVAAGYRASLTVPIIGDGAFLGFLFFNSFQAEVFTPQVLERLRPYAELIGLAVIRELDTVRMMRAAVMMIRKVSSARDEETGSHLARMARYARLIANCIAPAHGLTDEFVEFVFQFCPLHDVGKVAVPDSVLFKPGPLSSDEIRVMRSHVAHGVDVVSTMMAEFGLASMPHAGILRNIVAYHHEAMDGSGYPYGMKGDGIPLEARIAAVADVFDALTSARPYKTAWSNADAMALLERQSGTKFDPQCVQALAGAVDAVREIQAKFRETIFD